MKFSSTGVFAVCALASLLVDALPVRAADLEALKKELVAVDTAFSDYSREHGMAAAFSNFAAEDAFRFEPGVGVIRGRAAIDESNKDVPAGFVLTWTPLSAEAAASGDMGYTFGCYESRRTLDDGSVRVSTGHYVTVWRRQADGAWKWAFDTGVPDPKPGEATPAAG